MASKTHPYIWVDQDGGYEYGLYHENKPAARKRFGTAHTHEAAGQALIAVLCRKYWRVRWLSLLSLGAGCGYLIQAVWPHLR